MEDHAARALHQRLDQDACQFARMAFEERVEGGNGRFVARQVDDMVFGQQALEEECMPSSGSHTAMVAMVSP